MFFTLQVTAMGLACPPRSVLAWPMIDEAEGEGVAIIEKQVDVVKATRATRYRVCA
jgi:hypothetical protein